MAANGAYVRRPDVCGDASPHAEKRKKGRCAGCADGGNRNPTGHGGEAPRLLEAVGISDFCAEIARKAFVVRSLKGKETGGRVLKKSLRSRRRSSC